MNIPANPGDVITDATHWGRDDFPDDRSWVRPIPDWVIDDIAKALPGLRERTLHPRDIRPEHFPLPRSGAFLAEVNGHLEAGPGFELLSGFPVDDFSYEDTALAYTGLAAHFGRISIQSHLDEYVVDVSDKGEKMGTGARGHYGSESLPFHADGANTVTLLCLQTAPEGGESLLVSGAAIYNAVLGEHPEYLDILYRGFHHHRRGEQAPDEAPVTPWRSPVFSFYGDQFHITYVRPSINYCEVEGTVITEAENRALDFVDSVIARPEIQVSMSLKPGDLQLVNNFVVLHSRTEYFDTPKQQRRLIRLWLDTPASRHNGPGKMDWYMPEHSRFLATRGHLLEGFAALPN
ncbi:MAG: TauD/TfdA family dioxygenase [Rhodospirillaceae bacterium]|nr:TauD/TfdA family dioxygenase [Rhodospirillaceae bacterium]MBT6087351.1 TauD/TfdA family dioxygenase [Rhodospirillaceae bacterium]